MSFGMKSELTKIGSLLKGDSFFSVPIYQRDFSWTDIQTEQLWLDILNTLDTPGSQHFLGAIVVTTKDDSTLDLIDGQQRLACISILFCVIRDLYKTFNDKKRADVIHNRIIGDVSIENMETRPKITLNEDNNRFYTNYILDECNYEDVERTVHSKDYNSSNRLLGKALLYFKRSIERELNNIKGSNDEKIKYLTSLVGCITNQLISILITVQSESDAYLIFETLNDRGLDLSVADLLKNFLFSKLPSRLIDAKRKWDFILDSLRSSDIKRYVRHYWLSKEGKVRERELYRKISTNIRGEKDAYAFLTDLSESSEIYGALEDPYSSYWSGYDAELRDDLIRLKMYNVVQCYPVLLAAKDKMSDRKFKQILRLVVIFSFRYSVICGLGTGNLETIFAELSRFIRNNNKCKTEDVFYIIEEIYPTDDMFVQSFNSKEIRRDSALARYILHEINNRMMGTSELIANPDKARLNLEHVLPKQPSDEWIEEIGNGQYNKYIHRLGNMTLIGSKINRKTSNRSFTDKLHIYKKSRLGINEFIAECNSWGIKRSRKDRDA